MAMEREREEDGAVGLSLVLDCVPVVMKKRRDSNLKVRARAAAGVVAGLRAQVQELEQQRDFLVSWKAETFAGVEGAFVDVEFQGLDGDRVHAHKAVLAAKSVELEAMFRADSEGKAVYHLDMPYEALKAFITFFYTGRISSSVVMDHFVILLEASLKYNVQFLTSVCEDSLVKIVTRENVINTFDVAQKHCSSKCKEAVVEKARRLGELASFTEYKIFTESNPGLLLELYEQLIDPPGQSSSKKKMKVSLLETDFELQPNDIDNEHISDDENIVIKSETDEDKSVGDEDAKTGDHQDQIMPGPCMQLNEVPPFGTPMYWHGSPNMPGQPTFRPGVGYENVPGFPYSGGQIRPSYNMPLMARPPYGISAFAPPGMLPRGYVGGATAALPGAPESPSAREDSSAFAGRKKEDPKKGKFQPKQHKEKRCLLRGVKTSHNKNKKFIATITVKGQHIVLGKCHTEEEAGRLYDRAAFVVGRKTNTELPDDMKEELKGISWDDFVASLQELTALEIKIHQAKLDTGNFNELGYSEEQEEEQELEQEQVQALEQSEQVLSDVSEHSFPAY